MSKFLVIRFSSIGDIVLTTPIVRALKTQLPDSEVHYLTKKKFKAIVENNIYIDKVYTIERDIDEIVEELKSENYDRVVDMHKSLRSVLTCWRLKRPYLSFNKVSIRKWIYYKLGINLLPDVHIVDRYFAAFGRLGIKNDGQGLDYFISNDDYVTLPIGNEYVAMVVGATYYTKQIPEEKIIEFCRSIDIPIILLGGKEEEGKGATICQTLNRSDVINGCGVYTLNQSAAIVKNAKIVVTPDTGLMHIAAAFEKNIISIWGTTSPKYGVYPYMPQCWDNSTIVDLELSCSPCSKFGLKTCPKKHFKCMKDVKIHNFLKS